MKTYALKRIALAPILLLCVSFGVFCLLNLNSINPAEVALRVNDITVTPQALSDMQRELGLNKPFFVRYIAWLSEAISGNLGLSYVTRTPVLDEIFHALPITLSLALCTLILILALSFSLGIYCGLHENSLGDRMARAFIFLSSAMPSFWFGLILILIFSVNLNLFDTSGYNGFKSLVLPSITLSIVHTSTYARMLRNTMISVSSQPFIAYAKARGLSKNLINRHIIKNALKPCIIALGMSVPKFIAGTFVVESIFGLNGVGRVCLQAIFSRDYPLISAHILLLSSAFIIFNLTADILVRKLDKRIQI
ncbi:ABC transporter permease subunit [Campylobacter sp. faydin G-140]|uniref:ABC transporter permease n=1 Tax=Campylobacter anatolicus TaxID=2829105 RepID=UPI001BA394E1|nr:ABC transporter permease subunit [Campylobacter anatolicus]MBR8466428.1 ABC transporter permease subunit [Campylobacter anatolicus]